MRFALPACATLFVLLAIAPGASAISVHPPKQWVDGMVDCVLHADLDLPTPLVDFAVCTAECATHHTCYCLPIENNPECGCRDDVETALGRSLL